MTQQDTPPVVPSPEPAPYAYPAYPRSSHEERPTRPPSTTLATWALVLAVIPIPLGNLVAIGQAVTVLLRCRDGQNHGKGQAIAALVIAPLWLVFALAAIVLNFSAAADRDPAGNITQAGTVSVTALEVGDCITNDILKEGLSRTVEVGPCSELHVAEVYADFKLADGPFPGRAQVDRLGGGGCDKRLDEFVGPDRNLSQLEINYLSPVAESWSLDRSVTCLVGTGAPSTGSLKGTPS